MTPLEAARALAELAEAELAALQGGRFDIFEDLAVRRDAVNAAVPDCLPTEARGDLRRAFAAQQQVTALLVAMRDEVAAELRAAHTGRRTAGAYHAAAGAVAGALDVSG